MLANAVKETTTTSGTGTVTLSEAAGFARFSAAFAVGDLVAYAIKDGSNWEWGIGTIGASNTLARTYVMATLVSGTYTTDGAAAIALSGSSADVFATNHSGAWQGIGSAQKTGSDVYIFGHGLSAGAFATQAQTTGQIVYSGVSIQRPFKVTALAINVTTASAGGTTARIGLYAADTAGVPGKLLVDAGDVATDSTGFKEASVSSFVLLPGQYWSAAIFSGTPTVRGAAYTMLPGVALDATAATALYAGLRSTGASYGALPDPASSAVNQANTVPGMVYVKGRNL